MKIVFQNIYFVQAGRITLLSLNEVGKMSETTIVLDKFVTKISYWLIVYRKIKTSLQHQRNMVHKYIFQMKQTTE